MKSLQLATGHRLAWRETGSGRPLVLIHGWSMSSAVFDEMLPLLGVDRLVLSPDLRGHGGSGQADGYGLEAFAADLGEWLLALGLAEVDLLGWSLGGQVAIRLARSGQIRVRRLLLVATTPRFVAAHDWPHGLPEGQVRVMARDLRRAYLKTQGDFFRLQFVGEELSGRRLKEIIDFAVREGALPVPDVALTALETLRRGDLRPELPQLALPVLVQQGECDRITLPGAARVLAAACPQSRLVLQPGLGHAPFLSAPQVSAELWREFLR